MSSVKPVQRPKISPVLRCLIALGSIGALGLLGGLVFLLPMLAPAFSCTLRYGGREGACEARYIPSESMIPTLQINDRIIIDKMVYKSRSPQRGDIILFHPTPALEQQNLKAPFIKRIVGLPGEKIEVKSGKVFINNQPLKESYLAEAPQYQWGPQVVPANQYFVLGDNRNNAYDSHFWGYVPRDLIIGQAVDRFYPPSRIGSLKTKPE